MLAVEFKWFEQILSEMTEDYNYRPAWWLPGANSQTIFPSLCLTSPSLERQRERFLLPDGDFIDLDWYLFAAKSSPIVIILHGLSGCSQSNYILSLQAALAQWGLRSVAMNFRGCSGEANWLPRSYHSGDTGDFDELVNRLLTSYPGVPIAAVGYSLGGNVLLKWLGEQAERAPLSAAVAVSVPFQLEACSKHLDKGFAQIYRNRLMGILKRQIRDKQRRFLDKGLYEHAQVLANLGDFYRCRTFSCFDEQVTAALHGFRGAHDYYQRSSSGNYLSKIRVSTLVIQAMNDPFIPVHSIPDVQQLPNAVSLRTYAQGGHVGFTQGRWPWRASSWLPIPIVSFLRQQLAGALDTPASGLQQNPSTTL